MNNNKLVQTSYSNEDVMILLKDLSGGMKALGTEERERMIQSGVHYSEMLPLEYKPTDQYMEIYDQSLIEMSKKTAMYTAIMAEHMYRRHNGNFVIISLARAGIPVGILAKRYIKLAYGKDIPHYSISIIRGKGVDVNAMEFIRKKHVDSIGVGHFQFLDGWTGKGAISNQLNEAVEQLRGVSSDWDKLDPDLAVIADPANICETCGTHSDFLIPSACLNSTVSGLVSRTILRDDLIDVAGGDFHGAVYFGDLVDEDKSITFIDTVTEYFKDISDEEIDRGLTESIHKGTITGMELVKGIDSEYGIGDINKIKPGVGETTRVLLRRIPWKVLIDSDNGTEGSDHIIRLCEEKHIPVEKHKLGNYTACGIIKDLSADA